jgi:DNA-binding NarL/FixJ family response regulator
MAPMTTSLQESSASGAASSAGPVEAGSLLLIEDNPIDALRTMALLRSTVPDMACRHVSTLADATPELLAASDCVLLDLNLPDAQDQEGLKEVLQRATEVPVVVLTGLDDPMHTGLESLRNGAQDYLTKDDLNATMLERSIRYAIERKGFEAHLASAAVMGAAAAILAKGEAASTAAVTTAAEAEVRSAAAVAATAAAEARSAVDLSVARQALATADAAAAAAVAAAAEVAGTARAAAAAAIAAATTAANAMSADAAASASAARVATLALASDIEQRASEASALAAAIGAATVTDLIAEAQATHRPSEASTATGAPALGTHREQAQRSLGIKVLILTAKLAVAVTIILALLLVLTSGSAS